MVEIKHAVINMLAHAIHNKFRGVYPDGLLMRIGTGWESGNLAAIDAWLRARHPKESPETWYVPLEYLIDVGFDRMLEQELNELSLFLRSQSEELWEGVCYPYPSPVPHLPQFEFTRELCRSMAHAHLEMIATWQPIHEVISHCGQVLPGDGDGVTKLTNWISDPQACYTHHPSELTLPLAHDLVRELYPDFHVHQ